MGQNEKLNYTGRAELVNCSCIFGVENINKFASCVGYEYVEEKIDFEKEIFKQPKEQEKPADVANEKKVEEHDTIREEPIYWRLAERIIHTYNEQSLEAPPWVRDTPEFESSDEYSADPKMKPPLKEPLIPWSGLWPFLKSALSSQAFLHAIDIRKTVQYIAERKTISKLPQKKKQTWAPQCQIVLDKSDHLAPLWEDEDTVINQLEAIRGKSGFDVLITTGGPQGPWYKNKVKPANKIRYTLPEPGSPIFIMSDLGYCATDEILKKSWHNFGKKYFTAGFNPIVLMLCPAYLWEENTSQIWRLACWDRGEKLPYFTNTYLKGSLPKKQDTTISEESTINNLLSLLSPTIRIEPSLLRAIRFLIPQKEANIGTEIKVWNHPNIQATSTECCINFDVKKPYQDQFRKKPVETKQKIIAYIKKYHDHLSPTITAEELLVAGYLTDQPIEKAITIFKKVFKTVKTDIELIEWFDRVCLRNKFDKDFWESVYAEILITLFIERNKSSLKQASCTIPVEIDREKFRWVLAQKETCTDIIQQGRILELVYNGYSAGFHLIRMKTVTKLTDITSVKVTGEILKKIRTDGNNIIIHTKETSKIKLESDYDTAVIELITKPLWATAIYRNQDILELTLPKNRKAVWFNPGEYLIEFKDTQKKITINRGFWWEENDYKTWKENSFKNIDWAVNTGIDDFGIFAEFTFNTITQRMRWIFPGTFLMGSPENETDRSDDEIQHEVMLTQGFWMADTACTQELWAVVMGDNPDNFNDNKQNPVENVSWEDCRKFFDIINKNIPGVTLGLPTEAQWEYACRAGTTTPFSFGENITTDQVNYDGNNPYNDGKKGEYREKTVPVKTFPCNDWGLYEMHGNVWEWCGDWYEEYQKYHVIDPIGPDKGAIRVYRGGSWIFGAVNCRSASRSYWLVPSLRSYNLGFRFCCLPSSATIQERK